MRFILAFLIPTLVTVSVGVGIDASAVVLSPDEQGFIVPGQFKEYLPQPIFYEGYIPLIFEFQTPKWNKTEVTFNNWYTCVSETAPYRYTCPLTFHMNKAILNLHVDFEGLHPGEMDHQETAQVEEMSQFYFNRLTSDSEFCSRIHKHFSSIYTQASDIEKYFQALKRCRIEWGWDNEVFDANKEEDVLTQRNITDYNYRIRTPFTRMENNFYNIFYKNIIAVDPTTTNISIANNSSSSTNATSVKNTFVASALLSNARTTLQAGVLGVYYAEKNRWIHANSDCVQGFIPQSIVTKAKFAKSLKNISLFKSFQETLELSISHNLISKYYTLPITDCSHTSDNMLIVRVQIPFIRKNRSKSLQLVQTHTLPFELNGHVCKIKLPGSQADHSSSSSGFFQDVRGSHYLYEELSGLAFPTDCKANELCKISEYGLNTKTLADRCSSALMARNHSIIRNHCPFQCRKQDLTETPLITRIHSNQYVITGSPLTIYIQCKGAVEQVYFIESPRIGAHLVNLPCNCAFTLKNTEKLKHIKFFGEGECPTYSTHQSKTITTNDYNGESMTFTKPEVIPIIPFHFARAKESHNHNNGGGGGMGPFYYENLSPDAKVNLADFLEDGLETYLFNRGGGGMENSGGSKHGNNYLASVASSSSSTAEEIVDGGGSSSSVTALWVVFLITTVFVLSLQAYILYIVKRNERVSYPKECERILYKVPDSPVM